MSNLSALSRPLAAAALLAACAAPGRADFVADSLVTISGNAATSGPGYFTGTVAVDNINNGLAVIRITLTNTSPLSNGGYITGFAFNDPNKTALGNISTVTAFEQSYNPAGAPPANNMSLIGGGSFSNSIAGSPYGSFDIGAATGGNLLGGGSPQPGIEVNQTGTFTFTVTGSGLNNLTADTLMNALSTGGGGGSAALLVRFRGFKDGDSDKVVAGVTGSSPPPGTTPVPAPAGLLLGLIGVGALTFGRGRRTPTAVA